MTDNRPVTAASPHRRLLYAHRGAAAEQPENTLPSFRRALEVGADALEMDAHMTCDGHVIISHDASGARMCGVPREIRSEPLAAVQSWDAGYGVIAEDGTRPFAGRGYRLPTLSEVLETFPTTPLNVDIKQSTPPMVDAVVDVVRRHDAEARVCLASFRWRTLLAVRIAGYAGATAAAQRELVPTLLVPNSLWRRAPWRADAAQIPVRHGRIELATPRIIAKLHDLGMRVDFWTINDPAEARRLLDLGADGIISDAPGAIAPVFAGVERPGRAPATMPTDHRVANTNQLES